MTKYFRHQLNVLERYLQNLPLTLNVLYFFSSLIMRCSQCPFFGRVSVSEKISLLVCRGGYSGGATGATPPLNTLLPPLKELFRCSTRCQCIFEKNYQYFKETFVNSNEYFYVKCNFELLKNGEV